MTGRCSQLEAEIDSMRTRLSETDAQFKEEQERKDWVGKKEVEGLRREVEETTAQKEQTMERLGIANSTVARLQVDLKIAQETAEVSQGNVRRAKYALDDIGSQVHALRSYVAAAQAKRQRAEEDLEDERRAKRRLIEERDISTRVCDAEKYEAERKQLEESLRVETLQRKEIEKSLAQANAKLDRVVVTDSLIAAFLKMDQFAVRVVEGTSP
jgi:chromosome segregation ATPase